jgi:hypothetical protein
MKIKTIKKKLIDHDLTIPALARILDYSPEYTWRIINGHLKSKKASQRIEEILKAKKR